MEPPMKRHALSVPLILILATGTALAQLRAPERTLPQIADPAMVVMDRGAELEVFPTKRAVPQADAAGRAVIHHVVAATAADPIGPLRLGVVFNHAMQQRGYISGEITFQMKRGHTASGLSSALYPGLKGITKPQVYVVNARTPAEFVAVFKRLQHRSDIEWVEPTVMYAAVDTTPSSQ
jgi:hypothetical protein